ncbi:DMT family transporter [Enterobacter ludwigii]|uniref:DMT family transporter n=1 Tax=Enterobacter ludwigii TaxID=299767 RepID=UPI003D24160C
MRQQINIKVFFVMLVICGIWGSQQVAMKSIQHNIPLALQIGIRSGAAALFVIILFNSRDRILHRLSNQKLLCSALAVGLFFALEFFFVSAAIFRTETSHVSLFLYTAPVFTAVGLHFLIPRERLNRYQWTGIALAMAGIAVAVGVNLSPESNWSLTGDLCSVSAGFVWGLSSILIRCSSLSRIPASCTLFYQLAVTSILLCSYAFMFDEYRIIPDGTSFLNLLCQTVVISFMSYMIWFSLLKKYQVASLSSLILMTPLIGLLTGHIILDETLTPGFITGAVLILTGLLFTIFFSGKSSMEHI